MQEFCSSNRMAVATESSHGAATPNVRVSRFRMAIGRVKESVTKESEEDFFVDLRQWHLSRTAMCWPFWLRRTIVGDVQSALEKFDGVKQVVNTFLESDKIRALLPLMMNTAVETQEQLIEMILEVQALSGTSMQGELQKLDS